MTSLRSNGHDLDNLRRGDALKTDGVVDVEYLLQGVLAREVWAQGMHDPLWASGGHDGGLTQAS